ncbi:hypothetical protein [Faecalispora jeddahensis]|uniref:hypothetical protein n=1 Tax=Faecalispora jeddahensis TaxID=1414721 RepID=UPI0004B242BF|nr:hypothetical protein [Faecalispora jeddahensis]
MGAWGAKLYQDDVAQDVRDQFKDLLHRGKSAEEITRQLIDEYTDAIDDPDDSPIFWLALADTQWNVGRLLPEVKKQAITWLDKGSDLKRWETENPEQAPIRKKELEELRQKLNSQQPPEKKISQYRLYKCEWKIGDVFAYKLESDLAKERGLLGCHLLVQKVDENTWHPGHIIPIVYVKITKDDQLPTCAEDFENLEYVQIFFTKYEDRFLPIDGKQPDEDIAEKSKMKYKVDDFGFLPQFRIGLLNTAKKVIPSKLIFIKNFPILPPTNEFITHSKFSIPSVSWKNFEEKLIDRYCGYNLRQYSIYSSKK